jgi:hypothetical protein
MEKFNRDVLFTDNIKTVYVTSGPEQLMLVVEVRLKSYSVSSERVKMELYGLWPGRWSRELVTGT